MWCKTMQAVERQYNIPTFVVEILYTHKITFDKNEMYLIQSIVKYMAAT